MSRTMVWRSRNRRAGGMLMNTMIDLRMTDDFETDPAVRELLGAGFPEKLDFVRSLTDPEITRRSAR